MAVSLAVATVLFAMIFKVMPQAKVGWHDVWIGAVLTAVLFEVGKSLIGLYIGKSSVTSSFAAAGSLVVLLVWVYYSAQIFLLGAEFTWVYAHEYGSLKNKVDQFDKTDAAQQAPPPEAPPQRSDPPQQIEALPQEKTPSSSLPGRPTLKQRVLVYAATSVAYLVLRAVLKRNASRPLQPRR